MIKAIILGHNIFATYVNKLINDAYNRVVEGYGGDRIEAVAYWDFFNSGKEDDADLPVLTTDQVKEYFADLRSEVLIVPNECYTGQNDFLTAFFNLGIGLENIYIAKKMGEALSTPEQIADMFDPYYSSRKLPYLEFHLADHCNLKCANCEHYSGLVEKPVFPDLERFSQDMRRLRRFFDDIGIIRVLGGEPLLNPQIEDYLRLVCNVYPSTPVRVVTNALLLKTMPASFFEALNSCCEGSGIDISLYPIMRDHIDAIRELLDGKKVNYTVSPVADLFRKQQRLTPGDDDEMMRKYRNCFQKGCVNLYEGKIAACFLPFTTKYFNAYFDKDLPENGAIDLYEEGLTTEELRRRMSVPFERCRYCTEPVEVPWHIIHEPSIIEDWI